MSPSPDPTVKKQELPRYHWALSPSMETASSGQMRD